jgi:conjugal transfer mating pair stabilization protein TraG
MDFTVYTWGSDVGFYNQMQGIKLLGQNNGYIEYIVYAFAMASAYYRMLSDDKLDSLKTLLKSLIIAQVFIVLFLHPSNSNIVIEDEVYERASTVSNVPVGIAVIKSFSSILERDLTKWLEGAYSTPDSLNLTNTGLGFTMMSTLQTMDANSKDPDILETFKYYFHNCIKPDLINRDKTIQGLKSTGDLKTDLSPVVEFETLVFNSTNKNGIEVSCSEAWEYLKPLISIEAQKFIENDLVARMNLNSTKVSQGLSDQANLFFGISKTGREYVEQEMIKNLLTYGQLESAKLTGGDTLRAVYSKTIADQANYENWRLSGEQAINNLPMVRNVYDIIFLGTLPILALLSASFANPKFILMGLSIMISLILWQPLGTILNFHYITELEDLARNLSYTGDFINSYKSEAISRAAQSKISFLMSIYSILPLLAMAILSGSGYALTRAFQAGTGTSAGVPKLAEDNSRGNVDLGNSSYNNSNGENLRTGSKDMINNGVAYSNRSGGDPFSNTSKIEQTNNGTSFNLNDTYGTQQASGAMGSVTVGEDGNIKTVSSPHLEEKISQSEKISEGEMQERVSTEAKDFTNAFSKDISDLYTSGKSSDTVSSVAQRYGMSKTQAESLDKEIQETKAKSFVDSLSESTKEQLIKDLNLSAGIGLDTGGSLFGSLLKKGVGFSVKADGTYSYRDVDNEEKTRSLSADEKIQFQQNFKSSLSNSLAENEDLSKGLAENVTNSESLSNTSLYKEAKQYNEKLSELEQYKTNQSHIKEEINQSGANVSNLVLDKYNSLKYGDEYKNATPEDKAIMSMNSLDELTNSNDSSIQNRLNLARNEVFRDFSNSIDGNHHEVSNTIDKTSHKLNGNDTVLNYDDNKSKMKNDFSSNNTFSSSNSDSIEAKKEEINNSNTGKSFIDLAPSFISNGIDKANEGSIFNSKGMDNSIRNLKKNLGTGDLEEKIEDMQKQLSSTHNPRNRVKER